VLISAPTGERPTDQPISPAAPARLAIDTATGADDFLVEIAVPDVDWLRTREPGELS